MVVRFQNSWIPDKLPQATAESNNILEIASLPVVRNSFKPGIEALVVALLF